MFSRIYTLGVGCYGAAIAIASKFSEKAKLRHVGAQEAFDTLESEIDKQENYIWFHAASLGEFEQGRPVIEKLLKQYPEKKIVLTFFSPSGYEVRKNYSGADVICYLPLDKPLLVNRFLDIVNPEMAVFIKYEFWANYLKALHKREIPTYIISAIFRPNQVFFKWYGKGFLNILNCFTKIYVQDTNSLQLLSKFGINHVEVVGDTRFDRVAQIANQAKELPIVKAFATDNDILVAGSTWEAQYFLHRLSVQASKL